MAVVCCATPSELYLEETRSTLGFASRAKLVKTNAKVNEVLDDQSLIRRLQRELAEAKRGFACNGGNQTDQLRALETEAANAGKERREAQEKLRRLQKSILNSSALFESRQVSSSSDFRNPTQRKRRLSDGNLNLRSSYETPSKYLKPPTPMSAPLGKEPLQVRVRSQLSPTTELALVRHAVAAKGAQTKALIDTIETKSHTIEMTESNIAKMQMERNVIVETLRTSEAEVFQLREQAQFFKGQLESAVLEKEKSIELLDNELKAKESVEQELASCNQHSSHIISSLEAEIGRLNDTLCSRESQKDKEIVELRSEKDSLNVMCKELEEKCRQRELGEKTISEENVRIAFQLAQLMTEKEEIQKERDEDKQRMQTSSGEIALLMGAMKDAAQEKGVLRCLIAELKDELKKETVDKDEANATLRSTCVQLQDAQALASMLEDRIANIESCSKAQSELQEANMKTRDEEITVLKMKLADLTEIASAQSDSLESTELSMMSLKASLDETKASCQNLEETLNAVNTEKNSAIQRVEGLQRSIEDYDQCLEDLTASANALEEENRALSVRVENVLRERDDMSSTTVTLRDELTNLSSARESLTEELQSSRAQLVEAGTTISDLEARITSLRAEFQLESSELVNERSELLNKLEQTNQHLLEKQETILVWEATISELNVTLSALETKYAEIVHSTSQLTMERNTAIDDRDTAVHAMSKEIENLKVSVTSSEEIIIECEAFIAELQNGLERAQMECSQRDRVIEDLTLERDGLRVDTHESRKILLSKIDELKSSLFRNEAMSASNTFVVPEVNESIALSENQANEGIISVEQLVHRIDVAKLTLQLTIAQVSAELEELRTSTLAKDAIIGMSASKCDLLLEQVDQLELKVDEQSTALDEITTERDDLRAKIQKAIDDHTSEIQALRSAVGAKDNMIVCLEEIKTEGDILRNNMQNEIDGLTAQLLELGSAVTIKEATIGQQLAAHEEISNDRDVLRNEMQKVIDGMTIEIHELRSAVAAKDNIVTEADNLRNKMQNEIDDLTAQLLELGSLVSTKEATIGQQLAALEAISTERDRLRIVIQKAIDDHTIELQEIRSTVAAKENMITEADNLRNKMQNEIDDLTAQLLELGSLVSTKEATLGQQLAALEAISTERDGLRIEVHKAIDGHTIEIQELRSTVAEKDATIGENVAIRDLRNQTQKEVDALIVEVQELRSVVASKDDEIGESMRKIKDLYIQMALLEASFEERATACEEMTLQREASRAEMEKMTEGLTSEITHLRSIVTVRDDAINVLNQKFTRLSQERDEIEAESRQLALTCNEAVHQQTCLQTAVDALYASRKELQQELDMVKDALSTLSIERDALLHKISSAENATRIEQGINSMASSELSQAMSSLEKQNFELTQLLADANASVTQAREAAFAADEELDLKERKLDEILSHLSLREEELSTCTKQLDDLKRRLQASDKSNDTEILLDTIKALKEERRQLEEFVANAADEREALEQKHRQRMGEEQRLLIRDAEREMSSLRTARDQLKSALAQSETDLFTLQHENERLVEEKTRLESKSLEFQKEVPLLEAEVCRLKSVNFDLTIEKKDLGSKIMILQKERSSKDLKTNEQVAKLSTEVNHHKTECYAARQHILELQESGRILELQSKKYIDEIQCEKQRRQEIESTISLLQSEIEKLRQRAQEKENAVDLDVSQQLQKEVEDLKNEIINRDARIKKLEGVRLTKEQCAVLKKIKVCSSAIHADLRIDSHRLAFQEERAQFQKENERYKRKLAESESEINSLRAQSSGINRSKQTGEDITALRFEKEALETKLRKYLAYCKALEGDKSQIIDALRANKRQVVDDDFVGAVVTLCDQLTSLEEECDALSSAEERVSSYLAETERLREQVSTLQMTLVESQNKLLDLARSESELSTQLKKAEKKYLSLRDEREKSRNRVGANNDAEVVPEKSRQVKYLEQENLQLMFDLKAVKKQLHAARSELDALRMRGLDDNSEDFSKQIASAERLSLSNNDMPSRAPEELDSTSEADKENSGNNNQMTEGKSVRGSAKAHRFSRAKSSRVREPMGRSVGLGDAGVDDENTGECRQS